MKLAFSAASPYVRKVMACAIARGIDGRIEKWTVDTTDPALAGSTRCPRCRRWSPMTGWRCTTAR